MLQTPADDDQCAHTAILKSATLLLSAAKPSEIENKNTASLNVEMESSGKSGDVREKKKHEIYVKFWPVRKCEALKCIIKSGVLRFSVSADNWVL